MHAIRPQLSDQLSIASPQVNTYISYIHVDVHTTRAYVREEGKQK